MEERSATATRPESPAERPRSDYYVPVAIVLFVLLLIQTLNRRWSQDYWIHQATLDTFRRDLWSPPHALLGTDDPFEYYSPYTFVLAVGARISGLSSVVVLQAAAIFNLVLFLVGFRLFVGQLTRGVAVTFALLATLIFWGIHPWRWSGFLNLNSIGFGLPYPSMFATGLALLVGWALLRYAATRNWRWLAFVGTGLVVVLLSHPYTGVWTGIMLVALAVHCRLYRRPTLVPLAVMLVAVSGALAAWPYYSFFRLFVGDRHSDSALLYTGLPLGLFAALPGLIALRRRWSKDHTDPLVLMFIGGTALYLLGAATANNNLGRVLPLIALPLQIGIGELLASFVTGVPRPSAALALLLTVCGIAGLIGVSPVIASFVPRPLLPASLRNNTSLQPLTSRYQALPGPLPRGSVIVVEKYVMEWVAPARGLYVLATSASAFVPDAGARRRASNEILAPRTDPAVRDALIARYKVRAVLCATPRCRAVRRPDDTSRRLDADLARCDVMVPEVISWLAPDAFLVGDVEYVCRPTRDRVRSTANRFCLLKARWQVESYAELLDEVAPRTMVEVGMYDGASMALTAQLARPRNVIGIDSRPSGSEALDEFISRHGLHAELHPHYGVDQADAEKLRAILAEDLADDEVDLVVDDASHLFDATRRTFNVLFPRLRPGGTYVIEDWPTHRIDHDPPLGLLLLELSLACSDAPGCVSELRVTKNDALVTRGAAELSATSFDLHEHLGPRAKTFLANLRSARP